MTMVSRVAFGSNPVNQIIDKECAEKNGDVVKRTAVRTGGVVAASVGIGAAANKYKAIAKPFEIAAKPYTWTKSGLSKMMAGTKKIFKIGAEKPGFVAKVVDTSSKYLNNTGKFLKNLPTPAKVVSIGAVVLGLGGTALAVTANSAAANAEKEVLAVNA